MPAVSPAESSPLKTGTKQSFETCGLITSEYVTVLQLLKQGFTEKQLLASLPGLTDSGAERVEALVDAVNKKGLTETFSAVNSEYARCSQGVYDLRGAPDPVSREGHFYFCAGENKLRYEILMAASLQAPEDEVLTQVPRQRQRIVQAIFDLYRDDGLPAAFDAIGDELKYCLNGES
ncbi:hypothetical protein [Marinobacter nanhaiticus]|uniref:hypothetical protein n=1 Tax=Marinobacter nanhaiticus TaxID=1305740 RepID=UPI0014616DF5|nr:hypothetical protein [Marinobacter nanhaiticus]